MRPVPPCDGEHVTNALETLLSIPYSALALIAFPSVANTPLLGFVGYFTGWDYTGDSEELPAGGAGLA